MCLGFESDDLSSWSFDRKIISPITLAVHNLCVECDFSVNSIGLHVQGGPKK